MSPVIPLILVGGVLLWLISLPHGLLASNFILLLMFMFIYARLDPAIGTFYTIMMLVVITYSIKNIGQTQVKSINIAGKNISGIPYILIIVLIGFLNYLIMRLLSSQAGGFIIGVPTLAATNSEILTSFTPAIAGTLGFIENRFWFVIFDIFRKYIFPFIPIIFLGPYSFLTALLFAGILFGLFHQIFLSGFVIFASMVMILWILQFFLGLGDGTSFGHFNWNGAIEIQKIGLKIF